MRLKKHQHTLNFWPSSTWKSHNWWHCHVWRKKIKFRRHCSWLNFDGLLEIIKVSLVDYAWEMMVGTTLDAKSSNFVVVKLIKFLNNVKVDYSVVRTSWTLIIGSTKCPSPSSIFVAMNKSLEVQTINPAWKNIVTSWSISHKNSSSLEEKLKFEEEL